MIRYLQVHRPKGRAAALRLREKADPFAKDVKETYIQKGGIIEIFGVQASGKSRYILRIRESAKELWRFPSIYIKSTDSLTDIINRNLGGTAKAVPQCSDEDDAPLEKIDLLKAKAEKSVLIVDDIDKFSGKKLELLKDLCRTARRIVYSAQSETSMNKTLRAILYRRKMKKHTIQLSSNASYDASNWLFIFLILGLAIGGFPEASMIVLMSRLALRGTQGIK
jgi:hypothetical protein